MKQLTKEQAIEFYDNKSWQQMGPNRRARFQIQQDRLCMPFDVFQAAVEETLGRPVFTHEFGLNRDGITAELLSDGESPTFEQIIDLLPKEKTLVVGI